MTNSKLVLSFSLLLLASFLCLFACKKESNESEITSSTTAITPNSSDDLTERGSDCGCEVKFNSIVDASGLNKPVQLWEFSFYSPSNVHGITFTGWPVGSGCFPGGSKAQLGVWYPLPVAVCDKLCNKVVFSAASGIGIACESWRVNASFTLRSQGQLLNMGLTANNHNTGNPSAPGSITYGISQNPLNNKCKPALCE